MSVRLVIITWKDSAQPNPAWRSYRAMREQLATIQAIECVSVGFLLRDDDEVKVLAQSLGGTEDDTGGNLQTAGVMTIPTACVVKIEPLLEVDEQVAA